MKCDPADKSRPSVLADYLPWLLPADATVLIDGSARDRLHRAAREAPPVDWIAVELRLAPGDDQVDLQQCLRRDAGDYPVALAHFERFAADPRFRGLSDFLAVLAAPCSEMARDVEELFFEYDLPVGSDPAPLPAVFLSLPDDRDRARSLIAEACALLRGEPLPANVLAAIGRCLDAAQGDASPSHLGLMLSRGVDAVRLNLKGLRRDDFAPFLDACDWPGDVARAQASFDWALGADRVTIALDVAAGPSPRIGFELFFDDQPAWDDRWRVMLEALKAEGLVTTDRASSFLAVPGDTLPTATSHWPARYVRQSLTRDPDDFSTFARRVSHIKLTEGPGPAREAKAYFGAGHLWMRGRRPEERWLPALAMRRPRQTVPLPGSRSPELEHAAANALRFLLHAQLQSGLWRDFHIGNAVGDEWVSAFVGTQLAECGAPGARPAAEECWCALLRSRREEGGWGYSRDYPPDADSTAWALRLAAALGRDDAPARAFLARHVCDEGGVTTYAEQAALARRIGVPSETSFAGWRQPHGCVTAAAAPFLPDAAEPYLRRFAAGGCWPGYWWVNDAYASGLTREFLGSDSICAVSPGPLDGLTAFDLAWTLRALIASGDAGEQTEQVAQALIARQQDDGGWPAGARLRVPMPGAVDPIGGGEHVTIDQRRNFTTGSALGALARWRKVRG